ncbi:MAG: NAD-dependent epimerase/dehydratase family protein, partial [Nanoarchaeota archaeon]
MKILITGGAGFIGSWIVDTLLENSHEVIIIDNLSTGKKENINVGATFYHADITDQKKIDDIFQKERPYLVIHAAAHALLRESIENPIQDATINILGTINILEACRKNNVQKIIYTSTGGARVGEPQYLPVDEKHPIKPLSPYGISKHTAEHYVELYSKLYNIDYFIFCFGNVYGPRDFPQSKRLVPFFIDTILKKQSPKIFGDGEQTRDFIYVEDLAEFIVTAIPHIGKTYSQLF